MEYSQAAFEIVAKSVIEKYHDPELDGPLLVSTRPNCKYVTEPAGWQSWMEYAAAIGHWPEHHNGSDYAQYTDNAADALVSLQRHALSLCLARQPEPDEDEHDTEPKDPFAGTAWSTGR